MTTHRPPSLLWFSRSSGLMNVMSPSALRRAGVGLPIPPGQAKSSSSSFCTPGASLLYLSNRSSKPLMRGTVLDESITLGMQVCSKTIALRNSGSKTPVSSCWIIWEDTTKWRGPFDARDEATGRISPMWVQSRVAYLCSSNAAPCCLALRILSSPRKAFTCKYKHNCHEIKHLLGTSMYIIHAASLLQIRSLSYKQMKIQTK